MNAGFLGRDGQTKSVFPVRRMPELNADAANAALKRLLLNCITPAMAAETEGLTSISKRINACMERVKVDASEGAALVAECVPHGRVMVAQAQKTLANLEALAVMERLVAELDEVQRGG